jgi:hypothetical protein
VEDGPYMNGEEELCGVSNFGTRGNSALTGSLPSVGLKYCRCDLIECGQRARDLSSTLPCLGVTPTHTQCGDWIGCLPTQRLLGRPLPAVIRNHQPLDGVIQLPGLVPCPLDLGWSRACHHCHSYHQQRLRQACLRLREYPMADHVGGLLGAAHIMGQIQYRCWHR